jgi:two-component system, chemotaxis family, chemotaxis protein CheY
MEPPNSNPSDPQSTPGSPASPEANASEQKPAESRPPRVLIVEDSRATRMVIRNFMKEFGFAVEEAGDGQEALKLLARDSQFNLFVVDWEMPVMNGIDFVRQYRASSMPQIPILMSTTVNAFEKIAEALEAGASDYIMKPFTKEIFATKLDLLGIDHK